MSIAGVLNTRAVTIGVGVLVGAAVIYFAGRRFLQGAIDAPDNYNRDTAYDSDASGPAGTAIRTLGHAVDDLSGNVLSQFGGWLGGKVYDWTHEEYDPNK
jgi:hypothetical protein